MRLNRIRISHPIFLGVLLTLLVMDLGRRTVRRLQHDAPFPTRTRNSSLGDMGVLLPPFQGCALIVVTSPTCGVSSKWRRSVIAEFRRFQDSHHFLGELVWVVAPSRTTVAAELPVGVEATDDLMLRTSTVAYREIEAAFHRVGSPLVLVAGPDRRVLYAETGAHFPPQGALPTQCVRTSLPGR